MRTSVRHDEAAPPARVGRLWPFELTVEPIGRFLNLELADDPTYDGLELQWFDDPLHGTGMLAFLSRRADRTVDYYFEPGLTLDPSGYAIGGGTGAWTETDFEVARLDIAADGVAADVRFTDVDGRLIEVRIDDRDGRPRRRGHLLAPVSSSIERPNALLLVWLHGFDLVHASGPTPVVRVDGRDVSTGRLPGAGVHRRHLVKYAAPLCAVQLNRSHDGPLTPGGPAEPAETDALVVERGGHVARFELDPAFPDLAELPDGAEREGTWRVEVDCSALTDGRWWATRTGKEVRLGLDVEGAWDPGPLPLLMRIVTRVVPVFRRWPTTYRWRATVTLGPEPVMTSLWERTDAHGSEGYRRLTRS